MAASYPTSIVVLSTKNDGDTIFASHVDAIQDETIAIETGLINGFQHVVKPFTDNTFDLGTTALSFRNLYTKGTTRFNGIDYTWPAADGAASQVLQTNGSKVLSWTASGTPIANDFRLSLTSGTSETTADVTAATTLFLAQHTGRRMTVFDGSGNATPLTSAEISIAVPATTSQMYDVFVFNNSGVLTLELLAWTNDTTRATAIVKTGALDAAGVYTKSGDTTRRYVGSCRTTTVSGQTEDSVSKRYVWNYYNRQPRLLEKTVAGTTNWNYTTATIRQANGGTGSLQVEAVIGVAEVLLDLQLQTVIYNVNACNVQIGIGVDSTTTFATPGGSIVHPGVANAFPIMARYQAYPAIGRHSYTWNEWSQVAGTTTWNNSTGGANNTPGGISGSVLG